MISVSHIKNATLNNPILQALLPHQVLAQTENYPKLFGSWESTERSWHSVFEFSICLLGAILQRLTALRVGLGRQVLPLLPPRLLL